MMFEKFAANLREWVNRLRGTIQPRSNDDAFRQELTHHLELAAEQLRSRGYPAAEAARLARARYGQADNALERLREQRSVPWFGVFTLDVKLGLRMLRKYLGLTVTGGLAMSVSFAIIIAIFMFLDITVWTDSVPLDEGDAVVAIQIWDPENSRRSEISVDDYERWRTELGTLEHLGAFRTVEHRLVYADGQVERLPVAAMSATGFEVARVAALLGRTLVAADELPGAEPVVVIGHDEWQSRFNGDPAVLGRILRLSGRFYTIVGVMPADFGFPLNHQLWIPLELAAVERVPAPPAGAVFGRLAAGKALEEAQAELRASGLLPLGLDNEPSEPLRPTVLRYAKNFVSDQDPDQFSQQTWSARLIIVLVSLLLIPPCVNIAMLIYARTATRQEEIAVRTALGASRRRIVLQLFIEMLVLSTLSALVALLSIRIVLRLFEASFLQTVQRLPFWIDFGLSMDAVLFALALAMFAAVIAGLLPALKATAKYVRPGLSALDSRNRLRLGTIWTVLVVAQVAFSFAALPTAIELGWGLLRSQLLGPGFAANEYLTARLSFEVSELYDPAQQALTDSEIAARMENAAIELISRLENDPRIVSRIATSTAPPGGGQWQRFRVAGSEYFNGELDGPGLQIGIPLVRSIRVDERYFDVFEVPVLTGRGFLAGEFEASAQAVLINATLARDVFGGTNPLGRRISYVAPANGDSLDVSRAETWFEVVGVIADRPAHPYGGSVFHPAARSSIYPMSIGFHVNSNSASLREELRQMVAALDPSLQIDAVQNLQEIYDSQATGNYIGGFALFAGSLSVLLLSAAGTYALMSFTVNQGRREIAIRMALGARSRKLLAGIFRRALRQLSLGAGIGLGVALWVQYKIPAARIGGLEVPGVLPSAIILILIVGLVAAFGPARRTLGIDPTEAIRNGT